MEDQRDTIKEAKRHARHRKADLNAHLTNKCSYPVLHRKTLTRQSGKDRRRQQVLYSRKCMGHRAARLSPRPHHGTPRVYSRKCMGHRAARPVSSTSPRYTEGLQQKVHGTQGSAARLLDLTTLHPGRLFSDLTRPSTKIIDILATKKNGTCRETLLPTVIRIL